MTAKETKRFLVRKEEGAPRGDLFELEQKSTFHVAEKSTGAILYSFHGLMEASLSRDTGLWSEYQYSGVSAVTIAADERWIIVTHHDGRVETFPLPGSDRQEDREEEDGRTKG